MAYQPNWRHTKKDLNSMLGFRPMLLIGLIASLVVMAAYGARAGICGDSVLRDQAASAHLVTLMASKSEERPEGYIWSALRSKSRLRLSGNVPSQEDQRTLLGMIKALFPDLEVKDRMKIVDIGTPTEQWLGAVSFGLQQLAHLKFGSVRLLKSSLRISGEASSNEDASIRAVERIGSPRSSVARFSPRSFASAQRRPSSPARYTKRPVMIGRASAFAARR